jgi:hypothetical protein
MKKEMIILGTITLCILMIGIATLPVSLADLAKLNVRGKLTNRDPTDKYSVLGLREGDKVKVVITDLEGEAVLRICLEENKLLFTQRGPKVLFTSPGEEELVAPSDGTYWLIFYRLSERERDWVRYKGYYEWED